MNNQDFRKISGASLDSYNFNSTEAVNSLDEPFFDLPEEIFLPQKVENEIANSNNGKGGAYSGTGPLSDKSLLEYQGPGDIVEIKAEAFKPEQTEALLTISSLLNSDLNPGRVLRDMLKPIRALFHANRAAVFLREQLPMPDPDNPDEIENNTENSAIICAASLGLSQKYIEHITEFYETKEFARLQNLGEPILVQDAQNDYRLNGVRELSQHEGFQTMLTLPLKYRQRLIGLLVLYHDSQHQYTAQETRLLTVFANQAALAIVNARLYHDTVRREREAAVIAQASRNFNSSLQSREVLNYVVHTAASLFGNTALIFIVRESGDAAKPTAFFSSAEPPPGIIIPSPVRTLEPIKSGEGVVGKTIQLGAPYFIQNSQEVLNSAPFIKPEYNVESLLSVPLKARGRTIGALVLYKIQLDSDAKSKKIRPLLKRSINLAQALADRAAIAIENARAYELELNEQRAKDEFLSFIAHELRTPLTSIKGYNHLLSKKLGQPDLTKLKSDPEEFVKSLARYSEVIETQSERLYNLIQDLSSIALIEKGSLAVHLRGLNLVELAQEVVEGVRNDLDTSQQGRVNHQIRLRCNQAEIEADLDPDSTKRILRNLLSNAIKFSPKGGAINVRVVQAPDEVVLAVQDFGIGISVDDQAHIFERLYKASSQPGKANGLGLGLYVAKSLTEAQGGRIEVVSQEGVGSTFTISFPLPPRQQSE